MEASVMQIFKYLLFDRHRFTYVKNKWFKQDNQGYETIVQQINQSEHKPDIGDKLLSEVSFTVFDLETTGFFPRIGDEVISIGAMKINENQIKFPESFYEVISPVKMPSTEVRNLTGLTRLQIQSGKSFPYAFLQFSNFSTDTAVVAHPASFDVNFLREMTIKWGLPTYNPLTVDSFEMANFIYPTKKNSLDELIRFFGIEEKLRHHALNDAFMTAEIFKYLIEELYDRGLYTLNEYWQAQKTHLSTK